MRREDSPWVQQGYTRQWWKGVKERGVPPHQWRHPPLPRAEREVFLAKHSRREIEEFFRDWRVWARDEQILPDDGVGPYEWDTALLLAGRGWGKTRTCVEWVLDKIRTHNYPLRIAIVGQGADDARNVMVNGESGFIECSPTWDKPVFRPSVGGGVVIWPNGTQAFIYSIADTEALRGPQFHFGWCDEPMAASRVQRERAIDNLEFCLRLGPHPQLVISTTPKPDPWLRSMEKQAKDPDNRILIVRGDTRDNEENLPDTFIKKVVRKYEGTRIGKQELEGKILGDEEGALWTEALLDSRRIEEAEPVDFAKTCDKVVVAVDPNTKSGETKASQQKKIAHAAGIVVCGKKHGKHYTIADCSVAGGPAKWAAAVVDAAIEYEADEIVAENNQGGDMVKLVLQQEMAKRDVRFPIHLTFAKKSKEGRAEPVANMYEAGDVYHVGPKAAFEDLELQMVYLHEGEDPTGEDFDRCDANVWGHTRLGLKKRASSAGSGRSPGVATFGDTLNGAAD